MKYFADQFLVK